MSIEIPATTNALRTNIGSHAPFVLAFHTLATCLLSFVPPKVCVKILLGGGRYECQGALGEEKDVGKVKELTDRHHNELGFVRTAALEEAVREKRLLVSCVNSSLVGFVHFRLCKDGHAAIYEIVVHPNYRSRGISKALVQEVINEAKKRGYHTLRLKCPIDLTANGFYARLGFVRVAIEDGK